MKDLRGTGLYGGLNSGKNQGQKIFCSESLKININFTIIIIFEKVLPAVHNCFQIMQTHSFSIKISLTNTILILMYSYYHIISRVFGGGSQILEGESLIGGS